MRIGEKRVNQICTFQTSDWQPLVYRSGRQAGRQVGAPGEQLCCTNKLAERKRTELQGLAGKEGKNNERFSRLEEIIGDSWGWERNGNVRT